MKLKVLSSFVIFVLFTFFLLQYIDETKTEAINDFKAHSLMSVKATYNAVIDTYEIAAKKDFNFLISNSKALKILHKLKNTEDMHKRNILRGELYRALYKSYDVMKEMHVKQFHIHSNRGKSLLRMHLPYRSEDSLMELRKSIRVANTEYKSIIGFEGGRIFSGFRYVYPIIDKNEHLGSVEFSISFEGIEAKLMQLLPMYSYELLIAKEESYNKTFNSFKSIHSVSAINKNYYVENPELSTTKQHLENSQIVSLIKQVRQLPFFDDRLAQHKDFTLDIVDRGKAYTINFINILNTNSVHAGYLLYFSEEPEILDIINKYREYKIIACFLVLMVFILLLVVLNQIDKLRHTKDKLQSINKSLSEAQKIAHFGSVEYNHIEDRYYLSDEVYNIFGVYPTSFKPSYRAFFLHIHPDDRKKVQEVYTHSIKNRTVYTMQHRLIKDSGEIVFVEEYGSHEFNNEGKIIKSIGSIYDITKQMMAYKNLERFIDLQNAIVILTDGINFQFANKSFYNFFGFENLETFIKEYRCICDRFINNSEFFSLEKVKEGEKHWVESLLNLSMRQRIVSMLDSTATPHAFNVTINKYDQNIYEIEFHDITDSVIEKLQLEKQLNRDQLTKAYNRVYFETNIENILQSNSTKNAKTGIIFLDIDHFKNINDTYGHSVGDEILVSLSRLINEQIRGYDHLIRWGGEEFIIIARVEISENILQMTEKLRLKIQNHNFQTVSKLTCSFGIALHQEDEPIKSTIARADEKLYEAKKSGRNQVKR